MHTHLPLRLNTHSQPNSTAQTQASMQACCAQEAPQRLLAWQEESLVAGTPPQARVRPPALPSSQPQVMIHLISNS